MPPRRVHPKSKLPFVRSIPLKRTGPQAAPSVTIDDMPAEILVLICDNFDRTDHATLFGLATVSRRLNTVALTRYYSLFGFDPEDGHVVLGGSELPFHILRAIHIDVQPLPLRIMDCSLGSGEWRFYLEKVTRILQRRPGFEEFRIDFQKGNTSLYSIGPLRGLLTALSKNPIRRLDFDARTLLMECRSEGTPISPRALKTLTEAHWCCAESDVNIFRPANSVTHPALKRWMIRSMNASGFALQTVILIGFFGSDLQELTLPNLSALSIVLHSKLIIASHLIPFLSRHPSITQLSLADQEWPPMQVHGPLPRDLLPNLRRILGPPDLFREIITAGPSFPLLETVEFERFADTIEHFRPTTISAGRSIYPRAAIRWSSSRNTISKTLTIFSSTVVKELAITIHPNQLIALVHDQYPYPPSLEVVLPPVLSQIGHLCIFCREENSWDWWNPDIVLQWGHLCSFVACFPRLRHLDVENIRTSLEDTAPQFVEKVVERLLEIESVKIQGIEKTLVEWRKR
jgi:hypothetical protein